jgi:hypothetical protein
VALGDGDERLELALAYVPAQAAVGATRDSAGRRGASDFRFGEVDLGKGAAGALGKYPAEYRRHHTVARAVEKRLTDVLLQSLDRVGDGRLGYIEARRCTCNALVPGNRQEGAHATQIGLHCGVFTPSLYNRTVRKFNTI